MTILKVAKPSSITAYAMLGCSAPNFSAHADTQLQIAAARQVLRAGGLQRQAPQMHKLTLAQLLSEIEDVLRTAPAGDYRVGQPDALGWIGRASSLLKRWNMTKGILFDAHAGGVFAPCSTFPASHHMNMLLILNEARHDLRLNEVGPLSIALQKGAVLDYFDEVRKVLATAKTDLLFVDPYVDPEFIARYTPQVPAGVTVRLLSKKGIAALLPAVELVERQHGLSIQVRGTNDLHDRFVFVDRTYGYQSGASFKDGGRLSSTIFSQITDALTQVLGVYKSQWKEATVHR